MYKKGKNVNKLLTLLCREEAHNYCELYGGYLAQVKQNYSFHQHCSIFNIVPHIKLKQNSIYRLIR